MSVFLPLWPTDRLYRTAGDKAPPPDKPLVLAGRDGRRRIVKAANRNALELGIRPGLAIAHAQARIPGLNIEPWTPEEDVAELERLALWALRRYSPIVAVDADGLLIETEGASHLFGGEEEMLDDLASSLASAHVTAQIALADTVGAAHALARYGSGQLIIAPVGNLRVIDDLPIAALRICDEHVTDLRRLGIETIAELSAKPRAPIALRFGSEPGLRLDQAYGRRSEPLTPIEPEELFYARRAFGEPIGTTESLAAAIELLVGELCLELERKGLGARRLDLVFTRVDNSRQILRIGTAKPNRDPKQLTRLLKGKLESVDPGFGVEVMVLSACITEPMKPEQSDTIAKAQPDISALVDNLSNRLGAQRLYRAASVESDVPERCIKLIAPLDPPSKTSWPRWPRPSRIISPPEPVDTLALLPDHPPVQFTWRGKRRAITAADGPERIFGEWWRSDRELNAVRDYFTVEDESGERYWLFRSGDGEYPETGSLKWFLHGIFG
jgi:protein ImuB